MGPGNVLQRRERGRASAGKVTCDGNFPDRRLPRLIDRLGGLNPRHDPQRRHQERGVVRRLESGKRDLAQPEASAEPGDHGHLFVEG